KVDVLEWKVLPGFDPFTSLSQFGGIQVNQGSITFPSLNARGFADAQNFRFLQFADGIDLTPPGLGYTFGNIGGPNNLDLRYIEILPGPGSALYGPNAFNGMLSVTSKDPFSYPGLSVELRAGLTNQENVGSFPLLNGNLRYAKVLNPKWAFKITGSVLSAQDWEMNDQSYHITPTRAPFADQFLNIPSDNPVFDAVSRYGDEVLVPVSLGPDSMIQVSRTGIAERDLVDYSSQIVKLGGALHFRPTAGVEAIYDVRYFQADAILRHTTVYPLRNIRYLAQKLELKGPDFQVKAYYSAENANDSYALLGTGAFIQEGLKVSPVWAGDYGAAYRGEVPGIQAGDHQAARLFADRDIPGPGNAQFDALREASLSSPDILTGGSRFIDRSSMLHVEAVYDFKDKIPYFNLQEGISYRQYFLRSEGQLFNDGSQGFNGVIPVLEYGAFAQASRSWWQERINLRASLRLDKNQNFEGQVSPRVSLTFAPDSAKKHNLRVAAQTGFRNPSPQESYIALDIGDAIILGGTLDNIDNYQFQTAEGQMVSGREIHLNLVSIPSLAAFQAGGGSDPSVLEFLRLDFLRQEQISTLELGYRGALFKRLFIDLTGYYNRYQDFVTRSLGYSLEAGRAFSVYTNFDAPIYAYGAEARVEYQDDRGYRARVSYVYNQFNAEEALTQNPNFFPGFNTPNHRAGAMVSNLDVYQGLGFSVAYRWQDALWWQSPFGQGEIPAYGVVDATLSYHLHAVKTVLKLGANNLLNQGYQTMYGGPVIGAQYYLSLTFDELLR
ncbi:MAG: TonB-dependent receptor, partial [Bacteroidota bacterium]